MLSQCDVYMACPAAIAHKCMLMKRHIFILIAFRFIRARGLLCLLLHPCEAAEQDQELNPRWQQKPIEQ